MQLKFVTTLNRILNNDPKLNSLNTYTFSIDETKQILHALKANTCLRSLSLLQNELIGKECGEAIVKSHCNFFSNEVKLSSQNMSILDVYEISSILKLSICDVKSNVC